MSEWQSSPQAQTTSRSQRQRSSAERARDVPFVEDSRGHGGQNYKESTILMND